MATQADIEQGVAHFQAELTRNAPAIAAILAEPVIIADSFAARRAAIENAERTGPLVGMPCTVGIGSDCYAGKVTRILSPKAIEVDAQGPEVWTLRKNGRWVPQGSSIRGSGYYLTLGFARDYRDPSF